MMASLLALLAFVVGTAQAQDWPAKPVRLILPFAAGGAADVVTRITMAKVSEQTGQQFLVDNRTGAAGNIGTEAAARAAPDGYTYLVGSPGTMAINPSLFRSLPYDARKDFVAVEGGAAGDVERAVAGLQARGARSIVLDLRGNGGGGLEAAIRVSELFLERGQTIATVRQRGEPRAAYLARRTTSPPSLPLAVLVDGFSASASEIVAGALKDHKRATIIGTRSFGKGSVQTIIPLGANGAIRLTTARYYTPSNRSIQAKGIDPDIVVEQAKIERAAARGTPRSEADLRGHLVGPEEEEAPAEAPAKPPEEDTEVPPETSVPEDAAPDDETAGPPEDSAEDYQLARALDLLRGLRILSSKPVAVN